KRCVRRRSRQPSGLLRAATRMVASPRMDAVPRPGRVAEAALLAGVGIVLAWAVLDGHGSRGGALATAGMVAIACAAAGIALGLRGTVPLPRLDRAGAVTVAAAGALTLWAGLSIWWSIAGDLSWNWL